MNSEIPPNKPELIAVHDPGKSSALAGFVSLAVCLAFLIPFGYLRFYGPEGRNIEELNMLTGGFTLGALFCAGWTIRVLLSRNSDKRVFKVNEEVIVCLDGRRQLWREPVSAYQQINWREKAIPTGGKYGGRAIVQSLTLVHPDATRAFEFHASQVEDTVHDRCREWSQVLGMPVYRETADQGLIRLPEEIDSTLTTLAAEGRFVPGNFDFTTPPPRGVKCGKDGDTLWANARMTWFYSFSAPLLLLLAVDTYHGRGEDPRIALILVGFTLAAAAVVIVLPFAVRQRIRITPEEVIGDFTLLGIPLRRKRLPFASIARIRQTRTFPDGVIIEARDNRIRIALLPTKAEAWLAAFLQSAILGPT